jgi:polyisoprenoid-binding protein YceI
MSTIETTTQIQSGTYKIDTAHSRIGFVARHAMVTKVRGSFKDVEGWGHFDADDPARTHLELTIKAASIDTGHADRDAHLRSSDFFDMENHPVIRFVSTSVVKLDEFRYNVTGDLTIKGVTKPVSVDFELGGAVVDPWGNQRIGFEGSTVVNRKDWGINWNAALEAGGFLVSEKVTIELDVAAVKVDDQN